VKYVVGGVDKEVVMKPQNYIECQLVLAPHDETTSQANDGHRKGWVCDNQFNCPYGRKAIVKDFMRVALFVGGLVI